MRERDGLITTTELAGVLHQPDLRLFDCTTYLEYQPEGSGVPYIAVPGRHTSRRAHIPGADFLDLQGEFSDQTTELRFMMPEIAQLEAAFGRHGIGAGSRVVLYRIGTRCGRRGSGGCSIARLRPRRVLDGGFDKWKAEGRPSRPGRPKGYPPAKFTAKPRAGLFVGKHAVLAAIGRARYRHRQRARSAVPQGPGAQPLRPAWPHSRQRQCFGRDAV